MLEFEVIDERQCPLWDYGWFNVTRFSVLGDIPQDSDPENFLSAFVASPTSRRWFCTRPDPWGASPVTHGPLLWKFMRADWYVRLSSSALNSRIQSALNSSEFDHPPSPEQSAPVLAWATAAETAGAALFELQLPEALDVRVEMNVWTVFFEFVCIDVGRRAMSVAVIGYD